MNTQTLRNTLVSAAKRRKKIARDILYGALGQHQVDNAFFPISFGDSLCGIFGSTPTDLMHALEEGIIKYITDTFLTPMPDSMASMLDAYVEKILGPTSSRCHNRRNFPRVNFTRGFSRLTLLSAEEQVGVMLVLVVVLSTKEGKDILVGRFGPEFDQKRTDRATRFKGAQPPTEEEYESSVIDEGEDEDKVHEDGNPIDEDEEDMEAPLPKQRRTTPVRPETMVINKANLDFLEVVIRRHDLTFLLTKTFPVLPKEHLAKALHILWKHTRKLKDATLEKVDIPTCLLDKRSFPPTPSTHGTTSILFAIFCQAKSGDEGEYKPPQTQDLPSKTKSIPDFIECCELVLAFRSYFQYSSSHCPQSELPQDGLSPSVELFQAGTAGMIEMVNRCVNRGEGTNGWNIQKVADLVHLPNNVMEFGPAEGFHVGFAERGLKSWAKQPARTAQKRSGGIFEKLVSSRMHEHTMIEKAMLHMSKEDVVDGDSIQSGEDSIQLDEDEDSLIPRMEPNGSCFRIKISRVNRRRVVSCTRLNRHMKDHQVPLTMPQPILDYFQKDRVDLRAGTVIEYRTEIVVEKLRYRAHPNYQASGPWYDWVNVTYETDWEDSTHLVQDTDFPAKILGFFRVLEPELPQSFKVLVHPVTYRIRGSALQRAETRLLRAWLLETKTNGRPSFTVINHNQIQDQILVVEENPGFHDQYLTDLDKRVWAVKDMRSSWPGQFHAFAASEYTIKLLEHDSDDDEEPISRNRSAQRACC